MSSTFTPAEITTLARLAQLDLDETELALFARQLNEILEYARQVQQIETAGVEPTASVTHVQETDRADDMRPSLPREEALGNAPDPASGAGLFRVPRVIG